MTKEIKAYFDECETGTDLLEVLDYLSQEITVEEVND